MASNDGGKSLDGDDPLDSPSTTDSTQPSVNMHPVTYTGMPMHMYPFPAGVVQAQPLRSKRRQVKNACTNCQKACKKCDDARPCLRCVKYGISEECVDSQRKERKKGIKRGPYKKRDGKGNTVESIDEPVQQGMPVSNGIPPPGGTPPMGYPIAPVPYPPSYYAQFPPPVPKPGEGQAYYHPQFLVPAMPAPHPQQQPHAGPEGENQGYAVPHPPFYQTFVPFAQPYPQYVVPARPDGQIPMPATHYAYGAHIYAKPMGSGNSGEMGHGGRTHVSRGNGVDESITEKSG